MALPNEIHPFQLLGNDANQFKIPYSLRFRNDGSNGAKLTRTFQNAGNRKTWTWSVWLKLGRQAQADSFLFAYNSGGGYNRTYHELLNGTITIGDYTTGYVWQVATTQVFRDPSAWYHYLVQFDTTQATAANRVRLYLNGSQITALSTASYPSQNYDAYINQAAEHVIASIGYANNSGFDGYMAEMYFIDGQALTPSSFGYTDNLTGQWVPKKYTGTYGTNGFYLPFKNNSPSVSTNNLLTYSEQFDNAAWGKPAAPVAPTVTANATTAPNGSITADRLEFSGVTTHPVYQEIGSLSIANGSYMTTSVYVKNYIAGSYNIQNYLSGFANADAYTNITFDANGVITQYSAAGSDAVNVTPRVYDVGNGWYRVVCMHLNASGGTQTNVRLSIGQSSMSGSSGIYVWGGQINTGGQVLPMYIPTVGSSVTTQYYHIGADDSYGGSSWNNWLASGISLSSPANTVTTTHDSYIDSPTSYDDGGNGRGNYAVLNPLTNSTVTISNANLTVGYTTYTNWIKATFGITSGKWYWEVAFTTSGVTSWVVGLSLSSASTSAEPITTSSWWYLGYNGTKYNGNSTSVAYGATWAAGDIIGVAFDADAGTVTYYKNNVSQGQAFSGLTNGPYFPSFGFESSGINWTQTVNFGQRPFTYTPPTGFKALNTYNLQNPSLPLV